MVEDQGSLCGVCWRETPFITGLVCESCGVPLAGQSEQVEKCDDCMKVARPWCKGAAALVYKGNGRKLVLALKHSDRQDLAGPAGRWMARRGRELLTHDALLVPVPLHWTRLFGRRYNQAALLALSIARHTGLKCVPDALIRSRRTDVQDRKGVPERFENLRSAIETRTRHHHLFADRPIVLVDDVMTSGATFAAAAEAVKRAGCADVFVLALARVAKDI